MKQSLSEFCENYGMEHLLSEWDSVENGALTPETVSYGSHRRIWWKCAAGHSWQAAPGRRTISASGCPYCGGKIVCDGRDLPSTHPKIAAEWNREKNRNLQPEEFSAGSHRNVWWKCAAGHEWQATIKSRTEGCGCPYCSNRRILQGVNDLAAVHPDIAAQWHPERNDGLTPASVLPGSPRRVWWQCAKGHVWRAAVYARVRGDGCPVCANKKAEAGENDLASASPVLAAEWDHEKNGPLTPDAVTAYSNRRVWWKCSLGHGWRTSPAARMTSSGGCPYCSGKKVLAGFNDLQTVRPDIAAQWHPVLNGNLTPAQVTKGSTKKVWWQCSDGHAWQALVSCRTGQGTGCPECAGKTKIAERNRLALAKLNAERQKALSDPPPAMIDSNRSKEINESK